MRKIIIDVNFSQTNAYCIQKVCLMKYTEGDSPIIVKGGVRGTTFPEGVYAPLMLSRPPLDAMPNSMKS